MPTISLNTISLPQANTSIDQNRPLSYLDWQRSHLGIGIDDPQIQYQKYITSFYTKTDKVAEEKGNKLREDYLSLIKQIGVIFNDDVEFERFKNIDYDSLTDIKIAIPYYAKKLKDIALFYVKKREELKSKKLEYSLAGSFGGIEKILYNKIVKSFTNDGRTTFTNDNPLITQSPYFSSIQNDFAVEIQELYSVDDPLYNTDDFINPLACLFNSLCTDSINSTLSGVIDPLSVINCESTGNNIQQLLEKAYSKYLGTDLSFISGGYYIPNVKTDELVIESGDNFFYWFSGKNVFGIPEGRFANTNINDYTWESTGSNDIADSDIILVSVGNTINGAWYRDTETIEVEADMNAVIKDGKIFKFPFSNYGVSAYGGEWSGPSIDETSVIEKRFYPSEEEFLNTQRSVYELYWNAFSSISTVIPINIQETTLGLDGGTASNDYDKADKIIVSKNTSNNKIYNSDYQIGWLYRFQQTQLPISVGENNIYFPITRYDSENELFFNYTSGAQVILSAIDVSTAFCGAVAANTISLADTIVKKQSICGPDIEMAWLMASPLKGLNPYYGGNCSCVNELQTFVTDWQYVSGGTQIGVSFKCDAGDYVRFIWTGETTNINTVKGMNGFSHDDSCPYKHMSHSTSLVDKNFLDDGNTALFEKWKKCTCQAIQYSPFGHIATAIENFGITPDFIVKDTGYPNNFNKKTWLGRDGKSYSNSQDCARFYPSLIELDIGWGPGNWQATNGSDFLLEKGGSYIYYRGKTNSCSLESPYFVCNSPIPATNLKTPECATTSNIPIWMKAVQNEDGEWIDAGGVSDMILSFGDFITYNHQDSIVETRQKMFYNNVDISSVSGSVVTLLSDDPLITFITSEVSTPSINFLIKIPLSNNNSYWGEKTDTKSYIVNDYLHVYQPPPLNVWLDNTTTIEYKFGNCGSECFVWTQPLTFNVYHPIKQWCELKIDTCVQSDILEYLNSEINNCNRPSNTCVSDCSNDNICGCDYNCFINKIGLSASNSRSELILNTELSGLPVFVNYKAKSNFVQPISVIDITNGENGLFVPIVTGDAIQSEKPWRNLINANRSVFVDEDTNTLYTKEELGFYMPHIVGVNRFETFDSSFAVNSSISDITLFSDKNYFDGSLIKDRTESNYIIKRTLGQNDGEPKLDYQYLSPYTSDTNGNLIGLFDNDLLFSPWQNMRWESSDRNFRNQLNTVCENNWFSRQLSLSGDVWNWQTDIYGNNYYIMMDNISYDSTPLSFGDVFVKNTNGKIFNISAALSSVFDKYKNLTFGTTDDSTYITTEDGSYITTEDGSYLIII